MSLLLDALKKAAEQKAAKSRSDITQVEESDETTVVSPAEDISVLENADISLRQSQSGSRDETVFDQTELQDHADVEATEMQDFTDVEATEMQTRLENTHIDSEAVDSEADEVTNTRLDATQQMQTGEDETMVFDTEDVSDFMGEPQLVSRERDDETELVPAETDVTDVSQLTRVDVTEAEVTRLEDATSTGDDTDMSQPFRPGDQIREDQTDLTAQAGTDDETEFTEQVAIADETDLTAQVGTDDEIEFTEQVATADETNFTAEVGNRDDTDSTTRVSSEDQTDISQPVIRADEVKLASPGEPADETSEVAVDHLDETQMDEDMSLLLVENEVTNLTSPTDPKDPREIPGVDDLSLVDTTHHRFPNQAGSATQTSSTGITQDNQTTRSTATQTQPTSTLTYAPDNYDRTLMKLPSDDASKIFAGMKSDSDVVMTPDYAKKVFRSKSSAQRRQHNNLYAGIAAIILIGILIFGLFEYTGESDNIDASLKLLKRDPMPGVISQAGQSESQNLFAGAETEVDERTIEIIESADSVVTEGTVAGAVKTDEATEVDTPAVEAETVVASVDAVKTRAVEAESSTSASQENVASNEPEAVEVESVGTASNLQVSSSTQVREKDILLREAYAAYRSGDNELAMTGYNQVIKLDPGNRNALLARAAINVQNGNSSAAIQDYQALLLANPKDSLAMTSFISVASIAPQDSETQLKLMIQNEPDSPYLNFALANAYSAQNRWPEAQGYYFRALQANPGDPNYAYNLAVSLEHISQPASAISYYQKALDNFENELATFNRDVVSQRMELLARK